MVSGQQRLAQRLRQPLGVARPVGQRERQHAGAAQAVQQCLCGGDIGRLRQAAEIDHHRGAQEQLGRALHPAAHLLDQSSHVEGTDAQVGDTDLADLEFAGGLVIHRRRAHRPVPVERDASEPSGGTRAGAIHGTLGSDLP